MRYAVNESWIEVKEFNEKRVVSLKDIAAIHKKTLTAIRSKRNYYRIELSHGDIIKNKALGSEIMVTENGYYIITGTYNTDEDLEVKKQMRLYFHPEDEDTQGDAVTEETEVPEPAAADPMIAMFEKFLDYQTKVLDEESKRNEDFRRLMSDAMSAMMMVIKSATTNEDSKTLETPKEPEKKNSPKEATQPLGELITKAIKKKPDTEYTLWKKEINQVAQKVCDAANGKYRDKNFVLSDAYKLLQKEYGICWDQYKKEFYELNHRTSYSTLELEYFIETSNSVYNNLLKSKLNSMLDEIKKEDAA